MELSPEQVKVRLEILKHDKQFPEFAGIIERLKIKDAITLHLALRVSKDAIYARIHHNRKSPMTDADVKMEQIALERIDAQIKRAKELLQ